MRKSILSLGLLTGVIATFALASCGSSQTTVKDFEGNDYTIEASKDKEVVAKSLVLTAKAVTATQAKYYALGAELNLDAEVSTAYEGIDLTANLAANLALKGSIGTNAYTAIYDITQKKPETITDEQIKQANDELAANLKGEAIFSATASLTASSEDEELKEGVEMFNGAKAEVSAAAFIENATETTPLTAYGEINGSVSATIYPLLSLVIPEEYADFFKESEDKKNMEVELNVMYGIAEIPDAENYVSGFSYYQTHTFDELLTAIGVDADTKLTAEFFESKEYETLVTAVDQLGLEITDAKGGSVTFGLNLTGDKIGALATLTGKKLTVEDLTNLAKLEKDKTYLKLEATIDAVKGLATGFKVELPDLSIIPLFVEDFPVEKFGGHLSVGYKLTTDGDVKFTKTKDANKTYVNPEDLALQGEAQVEDQPK
ncbi:MAG: hypothetical protein K6B64_06475 [Acholeplasmatales bacterium]|nr:hypothetical protein [Acholeplasmatales bacterium]